MNYDEMSDKEINELVTAKLYNCEEWELNNERTAFYHCGVDGSGYYVQPIVNYCHNASEAFPVIEANWISLVCRGIEWKCYTINILTLDEIFHAYDENPLRAAMICYLNMWEANNE